jgi:predicted nucleotidyltransferase
MYRYNFEDVTGIGGNIRHVYPIKQRAVADIISRLPSSVNRCYVFGSAITLRCGWESDIDICVVGNLTMQEKEAIVRGLNSPVDMICISESEFSKNDQASVFMEVKKNGLLVYKKRGVLQ